MPSASSAKDLLGLAGQLPDGTVIWTLPGGQVHVTAPGSALLFPSLCVPTARLTLVRCPPNQPGADRSRQDAAPHPNPRPEPRQHHRQERRDNHKHSIQCLAREPRTLRNPRRPQRDPPPFSVLPRVLNFVGIAVFAASGAVVGVRKGFDIFGIAVMGVLTARRRRHSPRYWARSPMSRSTPSPRSGSASSQDRRSQRYFYWRPRHSTGTRSADRESHRTRAADDPAAGRVETVR